MWPKNVTNAAAANVTNAANKQASQNSAQNDVVRPITRSRSLKMEVIELDLSDDDGDKCERSSAKSAKRSQSPELRENGASSYKVTACESASTTSTANRNSLSTSLSSSSSPSSKNETIKESNEMICAELNIRKRDVEDCEFAMLDQSRLEDPLMLSGKFFQLGGFRNSDQFAITLRSNGEMSFAVNDQEDLINLTLGITDIVFAAGIFYKPLYAIVLYIEESISSMYLKNLKGLKSYDQSVPSNHKSNSEIVLLLQMKREDENFLAQKIYLYFRKTFDTIVGSNSKKNNAKFNFSFIMAAKGKEIINDAFVNRTKPCDVERFLFGYKCAPPEIILKYPLNKPSESPLPITTEDLLCLNDGEFLNDNIICFYLKYLYYDVLSEKDRKRTHIFNTFFYAKLAQNLCRSKGEYSNPNSPTKRHARVKNWTRNINIFDKDFLIIPINKDAHWFMVIICYPYLLEPVFENNGGQNNDNGELQEAANKNTKNISKSIKNSTEIRKLIESSANSSDKLASLEDIDDDEDDDRNVINKMSSIKNCVKMPIILIFDSLKLNKHTGVIRNLRDYLISEWRARYLNVPDLTAAEEDKHMKLFKELCSVTVNVPRQNNFYDCGIFMLQYVESFFKTPIRKYDLPINLENWFTPEVTNEKRVRIKAIIEDLAKKQKEQLQQQQKQK